jgi:hypothetical protein
MANSPGAQADDLGAVIQKWRIQRGYSEQDLAQCLLNDNFPSHYGNVEALASQIQDLERGGWPLLTVSLKQFVNGCGHCLVLTRAEREQLTIAASLSLLSKVTPGVWYPGMI